MNNLEKFVFIEMTWKQFGKLDSREYYKTLDLLTEEEESLSIKISSELHEIYNYINSNFSKKEIVHSIKEYNEKISPVSEIILKVSSDFGISLKGEISEVFKNTILKTLGKDFLNDFLNKINQ